MTYLFQDLEKIFNAILFSCHNQEGFHELTTILSKEVTKATHCIKEAYLKTPSSQAFEKFIRLHHNCLVDMLDSLSAHIDIERTKLKYVNIGRHSPLEQMLSAYHYMDTLLEFIHSVFGKYLANHDRLPAQTIITHIAEIKQYMLFIEKHLGVDLNPQLKIFLLGPFTNFITLQKFATWHNLFYCRIIFKEFKQLTYPNSDFCSEDILWMLYSINYNSRSFYKFITAYIKQLKSDNYLDTLYSFLRTARQTFIKPDVCYKIKHTKLDKMLEKWLQEEIKYLKKSTQLQLPIKPGQTADGKQPTEKILTNLSVAELAYGIKLLEEAELLTIENHQQFFQAVAQNYRTPKSENISSTSLRNKFYSTETNVKNSIKSHIITMLNRINTSRN